MKAYRSGKRKNDVYSRMRLIAKDLTDAEIEELANYAFAVNQSTQNIGARRLYTIMERMLEAAPGNANWKKNLDWFRSRIAALETQAAE